MRMETPVLGTSAVTEVPGCDRCARPMVASGWTPKPDGCGGLRRVTVYRCLACARGYDALAGHHDLARS